MAQKVSADKLQQIEALARRGVPQRQIADRVGVSRPFVCHYLKRLRLGDAPLARAVTAEPAPTPSAPAVAPDATAIASSEVAEGADLETVDRWIEITQSAASAAQARGDFREMSSLLLRLTGLLEHKRKVQPPLAPDPNSNPDFVAAAKTVRERWHKLLEGLAGK